MARRACSSRSPGLEREPPFDKLILLFFFRYLEGLEGATSTNLCLIRLV